MLLKFIFILIIGLIASSLISFYLAIRPVRIISSIIPAHYQVRFESLTLHTADHLQISGWYIPSQKKTTQAIILLHGYPADKGDILPSRIFLHTNFNLLFLDFRYFGKSEGAYSTIGKKEIEDVRAAVNFLQSKGMTEIGLWGFSLGGSVAIMAAAEIPSIGAVVSESAFASLYEMVYDYYRFPILNYPLAELTRLWGLLFLGQDVKTVSPAESLQKLKIPVLLIHSRQDSVIAFKHAELLEKAAAKMPNVKTIFVDQLRHGESIENDQAIISQFFQKSLSKKTLRQR